MAKSVLALWWLSTRNEIHVYFVLAKKPFECKTRGIPSPCRHKTWAFPRLFKRLFTSGKDTLLISVIQCGEYKYVCSQICRRHFFAVVIPYSDGKYDGFAECRRRFRGLMTQRRGRRSSWGREANPPACQPASPSDDVTCWQDINRLHLITHRRHWMGRVRYLCAIIQTESLMVPWIVWQACSDRQNFPLLIYI